MYLLPKTYWKSHLQEVEGHKKSWKETIETNAFAVVIDQRSKQRSSAGSASTSARGSARGSASSARGGGSKGKASTAKAAAGLLKAASGRTPGEKHGKMWHAEELEDLKELAAYRKSKDWDLIAKELGTGRTSRAVHEKWVEFEKTQELSGSTGDELMKLVIAASGGSSRDDDDLVVEGGAFVEHARENARLLKEDGLAPRDPVWHEARTAEGMVYYLNATTGESTWEAPPSDYGDVITAEERLEWKDAAYNERFAEQDRAAMSAVEAEAEAEEVRQLEMSNLGMQPLGEDAMEEEEAARSPRGSGSGRRDEERAAAAAMSAVAAQEQASPEAELLSGLRRKREY